MEYSKIIDKLDPIMSALNKEPCIHPATGGIPCLEPDRFPGKGWNQWDPSKMCSGCAAYWHLGCAVNELRDLLRREEISQIG